MKKSGYSVPKGIEQPLVFLNIFFDETFRL